MKSFETISSSSLFLGPAAKGLPGVATLFEVHGHQAMVVTPSNATLTALCKELGIKAPIANIAEPVVVVLRSIRMEHEQDDGLGIDDGLGDGL